MALSPAAVAYVTIGGLIFYSGLKGATLSATAKAVLSGNLTLTNTQKAGTPVLVAAGSGSGSSGGSTAGGTGPVSSPTAYQAYAFSLFPQFGWDTGQQQPLVNLWNQESGWNPTAQNPTSTAYGIAQFLDATWGPYGAKTSDGDTQIRYGLEYIRDRYGTPAMAWGHEQANNWY